MHDISSLDLLNDKDQMAALLVVGNFTLYAFVEIMFTKRKYCVKLSSNCDPKATVCLITFVQ